MNAPRSSHYDQAASLLKSALETMKDVEIPDHEVPPVLTDFAVWMALRLANTPGGEALVERMRGEVTQWSLGEHPMQESMRQSGENVRPAALVLEDMDLDAAPLRIAMEHMLSHQRMDLAKAAACFIVFALGLAHDRMGPATAKALVNTAKEELKRLGNGRA